MKPFVLATIGNRPYGEYVSSLIRLTGLAFEYCLAGGFDPVQQLYAVVSTMRSTGAAERTCGILWVEHDHAFTANDVVALLGFAETRPGSVCGGLYQRRMMDGVVGTRLEKVSDSPPAWTSDFLGFGFLFTPWSVYEALQEPWFNAVWDNEGGTRPWRRINPDEFLSKCCLAAGIPLYALELPTLTHAHEPGQRGLPLEA